MYPCYAVTLLRDIQYGAPEALETLLCLNRIRRHIHLHHPVCDQKLVITNEPGKSRVDQGPNEARNGTEADPT